MDTAIKKFGTGSGLFDGTGDYLETANHADFDMGSGNFTFDAWVYLAAAVTNAEICNFNNSGGTAGQRLFIEAGRLKMLLKDTADATMIDAYVTTGTVTPETWVHIAFVREGSDVYGFIDGVKGTIVTLGGNGSLKAYGNPTQIGRSHDASAALNGQLDEIRISKGVARWTANFTPPAAEYA